MKKKQKKLSLKKLLKKPKIMLPVVTIFLVIVCVVISFMLPQKSGTLSTVSVSSLKEILEIEDLSTVEYTYNAVAEKKSEDGKKTLYYVSYEGKIKAGIKFKDIEFNINEEEKIIKIFIPSVEILETSVVFETMDFIFLNKKYETEKITNEAFQLCLNNLAENCQGESLILKTAEENTKLAIEALFKPWIHTIDSTYKIEITTKEAE